MPEQIRADKEPDFEKPETSESKDENDGIAGIVREILKGESNDKLSIEKVAKIAAEGKFDKDGASTVAYAALDAYEKRGVEAFERAVNRKLEEMKSPYRISVDTTFAGIQDIGHLGVALVDSRNGKVVDKCGASVNNSPRVPHPPFEFPPFENPGKVLPPEWPRLDLPEFPKKRAQ